MTPRTRRRYVPVRTGTELVEVDAIAREAFTVGGKTNRSAAIRALLTLGARAWRRGERP